MARPLGKQKEIQELTASEPLSLEEEYENQISWRQSADKLTFIICLPRDASNDGETAEVGKDDAEERMLGDINFFLYDDNEDEDDEAEESADPARGGRKERKVFGEVDIMIAESAQRGQGLGRAALRAFLAFIRTNLERTLAEYAGAFCQGKAEEVRLTKLVAKIKERNVLSRALFRSLGFVEVGAANYFGEIEMVLEGFTKGHWDLEEEERYIEIEYRVES